MSGLRQPRRPVNGFLALLPSEAGADAQAISREFEAYYCQARGFFQHSRALELAACDYERMKRPDLATTARTQSSVDHRMACQKLLEAARCARRLLRWSALDWRPTVDVVGSGLSAEEILELCAVMGTDRWESNNDGL